MEEHHRLGRHHVGAGHGDDSSALAPAVRNVQFARSQFPRRSMREEGSGKRRDEGSGMREPQTPRVVWRPPTLVPHPLFALPSSLFPNVPVASENFTSPERFAAERLTSAPVMLHG